MSYHVPLFPWNLPFTYFLCISIKGLLASWTPRLEISIIFSSPTPAFHQYQTLGAWGGTWTEGSQSRFTQLFSVTSITYALWPDHSLAACMGNISVCHGDIWSLHDCFDVLVLETKHPNYSQQNTFNWDTEVKGLSVAIVSEAHMWSAA